MPSGRINAFIAIALLTGLTLTVCCTMATDDQTTNSVQGVSSCTNILKTVTPGEHVRLEAPTGDYIYGWTITTVGGSDNLYASFYNGNHQLTPNDISSRVLEFDAPAIAAQTIYEVHLTLTASALNTCQDTTCGKVIINLLGCPLGNHVDICADVAGDEQFSYSGSTTGLLLKWYVVDPKGNPLATSTGASTYTVKWGNYVTTPGPGTYTVKFEVYNAPTGTPGDKPVYSCSKTVALVPKPKAAISSS